MSERAYNIAKGYRYGFNGQEKDDEAKGSGNSYDFGERIYDTRVGRFLSVDILGKDLPWQSSFQFADNNPIFYFDEDGNVAKPAPKPQGADFSAIKANKRGYDNLNWYQTKVDVFGYNSVVSAWNGIVGAAEMAVNAFSEEGREINADAMIVQPLMWLTKSGDEKKEDIYNALTNIETYENLAGAFLLNKAAKIGGAPNLSKYSGRAAAISRAYAGEIIKRIPKSKLPRSISVIVDTKTGKAYYGKSGGLKPDAKLNKQLKSLLPKENLEKWDVTNCSECEALNNALNAGADIKDLEMHTLKIDKKTGAFSDFKKCSNCEVTTKKVKTTSNE